jgi:hypothetical protein
VQLDSDKSADTVGRVAKPLRLIEGAGGTAELHGTLLICGRDNIERVLDGRWRGLSAGFRPASREGFSVIDYGFRSTGRYLAVLVREIAHDDDAHTEILWVPSDCIFAEDGGRECNRVLTDEKVVC